jgi:hypothetical protein
MRRRAGEVHRRQRGRGKQHDTKVCHDDLGPPENVHAKVLSRAFGMTINSQPLGRIVAAAKRGWLLF